MPESLIVELSVRERTSALAYQARDENRANVSLVLAHGAGAGQQSAFMVEFANGLASRGVDVLTFNFLYTEQHRRAPDRNDKLEACYRAAIAAARRHSPFARNRLFIGGKSMGGRIATHLAAAGDAASMGISGVMLLGYPLHPPGKPEQLRAAHLANIQVPMLFVQGARDPFGTPDELRPILDRLVARVTLHVVAGGDHSLTPKVRGQPVDRGYGDLQDVIVDWLGRASTA